MDSLQYNLQTLEEIEVLESVAGSKSRWRSKFIEDRRTVIEGGERKPSWSELGGKTFELWYEGDDLRSRNIDGSPASELEAKLLSGHYGPRKGTWNTIFDTLPTRSFAIGEPYEVPAESVARVDRGANQLQSITLELRDVDHSEGTAVFGVKTVTSEPVPGLDTRVIVHATGTFKAQLSDGLFTEYDVRGRSSFDFRGDQWGLERSLSTRSEQLPAASPRVDGVAQ